MFAVGRGMPPPRQAPGPGGAAQCKWPGDSDPGRSRPGAAGTSPGLRFKGPDSDAGPCARLAPGRMNSQGREAASGQPCGQPYYDD